MCTSPGGTCARFIVLAAVLGSSGCFHSTGLTGESDATTDAVSEVLDPPTPTRFLESLKCQVDLRKIIFTLAAWSFCPTKEGNSHIGSQAVSKLVKRWTQAINLNGNYGAHTLRKTWGYIQRTVHGVGFEIICKRYNHSSPAITMRYLGIQDKEVHNILMNEIG